MMHITNSPISSYLTGANVRRFMNNRLKEYSASQGSGENEQVDPDAPISPFIVAGNGYAWEQAPQNTTVATLTLDAPDSFLTNGTSYNIGDMFLYRRRNVDVIAGAEILLDNVELSLMILPDDQNEFNTQTKLSRIIYHGPSETGENVERDILRLISYCCLSGSQNDELEMSDYMVPECSSLVTLGNIYPDLELGEDVGLVSDEGIQLGTLLNSTSEVIDRVYWGELDANSAELFMQTDLAVAVLEDYMSRDESIFKEEELENDALDK